MSTDEPAPVRDEPAPVRLWVVVDPYDLPLRHPGGGLFLTTSRAHAEHQAEVHADDWPPEAGTWRAAPVSLA